jgi:hypothetical protein
LLHQEITVTFRHIVRIQMLDLRFQQPFVRPANRPAKLNRQHPLFSQKNMICAAVAVSGGMHDLITETTVTNTTTLTGNDHNGQYIWSNDLAGTATINFPQAAVSAQFNCWGSIFRCMGTGRQYLNGTTTNTAFFTNGSVFSFDIAGGTELSITLVNGHTYFAFQNNAVGTASQNRTMILVSLTTGQVWTQSQASTGNITPNPTFGLGVAGAFTGNWRLYAMFWTASVLVPSAVQPAATFYSVDQQMAGLANPWSLWYA